VKRLLDAYDARGPAYDEMFAGTTPRAPYARLLRALTHLSQEDLAARVDSLHSGYLDQGVTFDIGGEERAFPIDILPRVIEQEQWTEIDRGVQQRVRALERFLADVYGAGEAFTDGLIPRRVVTTSTHYCRESFGVEAPNGVRVHVSGIDLVGAAMHNRFLAEDKPGATSRSGTLYSTWWNGGLRTTVYFHNMIGLLTETIGNPTPMEVAFVPSRQLPKADLISPIAPQKWHFRQSIEYSLTANRAVLDVASKYREDFLYNIYRMGRNSIERGGRDTWTMSPHRIADLQALVAKERQPQTGRVQEGDTSSDAPPLPGAARGVPARYFEALRKPEDRDPRGFIIPSDQPDFLTATKFVNALIKTGVTVHQAAKDFEVAGKRYPAGSYVVKTTQAFRPHVLDMFEPQEHPNDFAYPGGPPIPPYDSAGWTLAYQMGVSFDRILDGFDGPFEKINGFARVPTAAARKVGNPAGFLISHEINDAFVAINRLLKSNADVYWLKDSITASGG